MSHKAICLNMIVKNERSNIERCLRSIAEHIACWVICDTGSDDGTPEFIQEFFAGRGIPGHLHRFPFESFSQARNRALQLARASDLTFEYILLTDADMELVGRISDFGVLDQPAYYVLQKFGLSSYWNLRIVRRDVEAIYVGVTHEYLDLPGVVASHREGVVFIDHASGANRAGKSRRDEELLRTALLREADPAMVARYTFYLANTLRDAGDVAGALPVYRRRAALGFWSEEIYVSLLNAARIEEGLNHGVEEVISSYLTAAGAGRDRAEALHGAARFCRNHGDFDRGCDFAERGLAIPAPERALFSEQWIYDYGLLDEFAVNAYWAGRYADSAKACRKLLADPTLEFNERERVVKNLGFARMRMGEASELHVASQNSPKSHRPATSAPRRSPPHWQPDRPLAGTELMVEGLRERLGPALGAIDLRVNLYDAATRDARSLVMWMHHDVDQAAVQWCRDSRLTEPVTRFVFISHWQQDRYINTFGLRPERCVVIRYAMVADAAPRRWEPAPVFRCAYTSTPFRGLDILLNVWERLPAGRAELHLWSSMKLYTMDDGPYRHLIERSQSMPGVIYHGLAPNAELRASLRSMHYLAYPNTFAETACLSVMEAMSAGCRVIVPSHGALPETTGGYARVYPWSPDPAIHAAAFAEALMQELADPWEGRLDVSRAQQEHCRTVFAWDRCLGEWRRLIASLGTTEARTRPAAPLPPPPPIATTLS